ncbi:carbon-nitrogen hydrolase family protein [Aeromicrobium camelliae]|uniref:carbon-nitrogen hydrolase family protein n=1 Tax=Aeromicrobium camelliae TaxID=1538144 RepID=UPI00140E8207|nr:carbon-nitrogen hydrolase family protein [Aeromicrobium camelliae]
MHVALVQSASVPGDLAGNVERHAAWIGQAAARGARLVGYPELSLTGYELDRVAADPALTLTSDDPRLAPLREACAATGATAIVGAPTMLDGRRRLAALVVDGEHIRVYAKRRLFGRETDVFTPGTTPLVVSVGDSRIAVGVCADLGSQEQVREAATLDADAWLLGSLVSAEGYELEARQAASASTLLGGVVAFANHAAPTGGWAPAGRSGAWDRGTLLAAADGRDETIVLFDLSAPALRRPPVRHG